MADTLEKGTKRKRGSLAKALLVTLIVVVLVIVLLPSIISLGPVRRMVISSVDDRVGGDLDIASWKLTWSRGVRVSGLSFKSEQINATVDSIETTSGLLKLLPREVNAGDIVITRPEVRYIQATRLDEAKEKPQSSSRHPSHKPKARPAEITPPPVGFDFFGHLVVRDGKLVVINGEDRSEIAAFDYAGDITCEGLGSPVKIDIRAGQSQAASPGRDALQLSGTLQFLRDGVFQPSWVAGELRLVADDLDLAVLAPIATFVPGFPSPSGQLNGNIDLTLRETRSVKGQLAVTDLGLNGGALGEDRLRVNKVNVDLDATAVEGGLKVERCEIASPVFELSANGDLTPVADAKYPQGDLMFDAKVNVATLAGQLRSTLKLRPGLQISEGTLRLIGSIKSKSDRVNGRVAGAIRNVAGSLESEAFALSAPIEFEIVAHDDSAGPAVDSFILKASFADISGRGSLSDAALRVEIQLARAMQELGHVFPLDFEISGTVGADVAMRRVEEGVHQLSLDGGIAGLKLEGLSRSERFEKVPDVNGDVAADVKIRLEGNEPVAVTGTMNAHSLQFSGGVFRNDQPYIAVADAIVNLYLTNDVVEIKQLRCASSMGALSLSGSVAQQREGQFPKGPMNMNANVNLAEVADQLPGVIGLGEGFDVSKGTVKIDGRVESLPEQLRFNLTGSLFDFAGSRDGIAVNLDEPLDVNVDGVFADSGVSFNQCVLRGGFGQIDAKGDLESAVVSADLDVSRTFSMVRPFIKKDTLDGQGRVNGTAKLRRSANGAYTLSMALPMEGLSITGITPKPWEPRDFNLRVDSELLFTTNRQVAGVRNTDITFQGLSGDWSIKSGEFLLGSGGLREADVELDLRGDAAELAAFGEETGLLKGNAPLSGSYSLALNSALKDGDLRIEKLALLFDGLEITCAGAIRDIDSSRDLRVHGQLDVDFEKAAKLCEALTGHRPDIEGVSRRDFSLALPLGEADWNARFRRATGSVQLSADRYKAFGVEAAPVDLDFAMKDGRARLSIDSAINEGQLSIAPYVDTTVQPPVLGVATNSKVLRDVKITDEMASELLALIHPVFQGCAILGGDADLTLAECRVPLRGEIAKNMKLEGRMRFENLRLAPAGLFDQILTLTGHKIDTVDVPDQNIDFQCREGRIHSTPLTISARGYSLVMHGSVGLDQTIDYIVEVPVTQKMVGKDIYPYVKDTSIKRHIGGTVNHPDLGKDAFARALRDLVKDAGSEALKQGAIKQGRKLLEDLLK